MNTYDDPDDGPDDDYWDDEPDRFVKEEPDCHVCNDAGCSHCRPGRVRLLVWSVQGFLRGLLTRRRRPFDDDPPF